MSVVEEAVAEAEASPPRLVDGRVEFHPAYHRAGRAVCATGIVGAGPARAGVDRQRAVYKALKVERHYCRVGLIRLGLIAVVCGALVVSGAGASFPGRNGWIVYSSTLFPAPSSGVVELQLTGAVVRRSLTARTGISGLLPAESPDGTMIAFVRAGRVHVSARDGSAIRDLGRGARPSWSPDGKKLAFSVWDPYQTLIVVELATAQRQRLGEGSNPSWSPDGRRLAFVHYAGLGVVDADGSGYRIVRPQRLSDWYHLDSPAWSPDGGRIAFSTVYGVYAGAPHTEGLVVFDVRTGTSFASREFARHPSWSPSGTSLVYVRARGRKSSKEVVLLEVERRTRQVLATVPFSAQCESGRTLSSLAFGASFSPRANRVAFASAERRNGRCRIAVGVAVPGRGARIVHREPWGTRPAGFLDDEIGEAGPHWLRDGRGVWIAAERRTLLPELYVRREDGSALRRLTHSAAGEQDPRFSADGRRLAFVRGKRGHDGVIWVSETSGLLGRPLVRGSYPAWSPDGRRIAFTRGDSLYSVPARGGRPTRLVRGPVSMPSWSPDGRLIAFARVRTRVERELYEARSAGVFTVDVRTRHVRKLTDDGLFPNWSPDGKLIAYTLWDIGPSNVDEQKSNRYPFLRLVSPTGVTVDSGDRYAYAVDVAWAPTGDRLVGSGLMRIRPPALGGDGRISSAPLPSPLGIDAVERDPDWQP